MSLLHSACTFKVIQVITKTALLTPRYALSMSMGIHTVRANGTSTSAIFVDSWCTPMKFSHLIHRSRLEKLRAARLRTSCILVTTPLSAATMVSVCAASRVAMASVPGKVYVSGSRSRPIRGSVTCPIDHIQRRLFLFVKMTPLNQLLKWEVLAAQTVSQST